jgi:coenzyme F420-0:L-glutamate ligase/coenzyme F420-1:gamma-L-glutamate ligase
MPAKIDLFAVPGLRLVEPGDDLAALLIAALRASDIALADGDVLVVAQKVVSKAEGRHVDLAGIDPSARAQELAEETGKDPRLVELILGESRRVVRHRRGVLIVEHRLGFVMANAGIDQSNVDPGIGSEPVLLLPVDPDASAKRLRDALQTAFGVAIGVIVSDSFGRAWRRGTVGTALGAAGLSPWRDLRGTADAFGRTLQHTDIGFADEIASAASLIMGQAGERQPAVIVRGLGDLGPSQPAASLIRPEHEDLFR